MGLIKVHQSGFRRSPLKVRLVGRVMVTKQPKQITLNLLACALALLLLAACGRGKEEAPATEGTFPVDPIFLKLHSSLGGESTLGPAISPVFENQGRFYQYTVSALLVYDPEAKAGENARLAPLGRDMGVAEPPSRQPETSEEAAPTHAIDEKIQPLFQKLGGADVVGDPLTAVHENDDKGRYEQYFENLGFYWAKEDDQAEVHLLAYGAWKCDRHCRHQTPLNSKIDLPTGSVTLFVRLVGAHGLDFTGLALTPPYITENGSLEQVYEHVVMLIEPAAPEVVRLLPLPEKVGVSRDILLPPDPAGEMYFYPEKDGLGYNIPAYFMEYIWQHGGLEFIGQPITQPATWDGKTFRQCFLNLCLQAQQTATGERQIQPEALGISYRELFYRPDGAAPSGEQAQDITIQMWERFPMVSPEQEQEIGVSVFSNGAPLADIAPEVDLLLPDGNIHQIMPPTDEKGESLMRVGPLNIENGSLIPYKVCVDTPKGQRFCLMDSYLIWKADFMTVSPSLVAENTSYIPFVLKNFRTYIPAVLDSYKMYLPLVNIGH